MELSAPQQSAAARGILGSPLTPPQRGGKFAGA
jgi:hypothetical protein